MPGVAERLRLAALLLAPVLMGCGVELVRPSVAPVAVEARPAGATLEVGVACRVDLDPDVLAAMASTRAEWAPRTGRGGDVEVLVTYGVPREAVDPAAVTAKTSQVLVSALQGAGVLRGGALAIGSPGADALACEARLVVTQVSEPVILTGARHLMSTLACLPPYVIGIPLCCMWTDREPDLVERCVLEVTVQGDDAPGARYEAVARGTISAQTPFASGALEGLVQARATLRELAIRSLVSQFAADESAHARLRALLDEGPPEALEPLLVAEERYLPRARWRTRRILGWKNESLKLHVTEARTAELRALAGRLEACMLDLAHESETSKDSAQGLVAGGETRDAKASREWSLAYRERLEVLRPILEAVKEELDARGR